VDCPTHLRFGREVFVLEIGSAAPDFTLKNSHGTTVTLSAIASAYAILVFYPKNNTPG